jgi:hypothetical protein
MSIFKKTIQAKPLVTNATNAIDFANEFVKTTTALSNANATIKKQKEHILLLEKRVDQMNAIAKDIITKLGGHYE